MNREIKFRAWIEKEDCDGDNPEYEMCYDLAFEEYEPINDLLNGVKNLMQYTGLKDKNGKEIYEGDILKCEIGNNEIVEFKKASFVCRYRTIDLYKLWLTQYIEVIGNIIENPELLNK
jgi:hypothetical protein